MTSELRFETRLASALQVYVIAHVPVGYLPYARGTPAVRERHNERLVAIFRAHSDVVAGHFYGHTHRDSVMVLLDPRGGTSVLMSKLRGGGTGCPPGRGHFASE